MRRALAVVVFVSLALAGSATAHADEARDAEPDRLSGERAAAAQALYASRFRSALDPGSLRLGELVLSVATGVPTITLAADVGLGYGLVASTSIAMHGLATVVLAPRLAWGASARLAFAGVWLGADVPVYIEDRELAPDSVSGADVDLVGEVRAGLTLLAAIRMYVIGRVRVVVDGAPPVDALEGTPRGTRFTPVGGAGIGLEGRVASAWMLGVEASGDVPGADYRAYAIAVKLAWTVPR